MFSRAKGSFSPQKKNLTASQADFASNHRKASIRKKSELSEEEIRYLYDQIHEPVISKPFAVQQLATEKPEDLSNTLTAAFQEKLEALEYLVKSSDDLVDHARKAASIHPLSPQEKFKLILNSPYRSTFTEQQKLEFFEIENALSNTYILPVLPTQVIEYQLALLWQANIEGQLSKELLDRLIAIRAEQVADHYKYRENSKGDKLFQTSCEEICESAYHVLSHDEVFKDSYTKFAKRLSGLQQETSILLERFKQLSARQKWESVIAANSCPDDKRLLSTLIEQINKLEVFQDDICSGENSVCKKEQFETPIKKNCVWYPFEASEATMLNWLLPEHKKSQLMLDAVAPTDLTAIMHASLSTYTEPPDENKTAAAQYFIHHIQNVANTATNQLSNTIIEEKASIIPCHANTLINEIDRIKKKYNEKITPEINQCKLVGKDLYMAYFKRGYSQIEISLEDKRQEIKHNYKKGKINNTTKQEEMKKSENDSLIKKKVLTRLEAFIFQHQSEEEILVFKHGMQIKKMEPTSSKSNSHAQSKEALAIPDNQPRYREQVDLILSNGSLFVNPKADKQQYKHKASKTSDFLASSLFY